MTENERVQKHLDLLIQRYPKLASSAKEIMDAFFMMKDCFEHGGKLLTAGNGGSAADCEHIAGELVKSFRMPRPVTKEYAGRLKEADAVIGEKLARNLERGLPVLPLTAFEALITAYINDKDGQDVFAQQLSVYGNKGDVFLAISTSGSSINILNAAAAARAGGIKIIGLTGADGGRLAKAADTAVRVPETETYRIQELHLPVYHCWCLMLEEYFFGENGK